MACTPKFFQKPGRKALERYQLRRSRMMSPGRSSPRAASICSRVIAGGSAVMRVSPIQIERADCDLLIVILGPRV